MPSGGIYLQDSFTASWTLHRIMGLSLGVTKSQHGIYVRCLREQVSLTRSAAGQALVHSPWHAKRLIGSYHSSSPRHPAWHLVNHSEGPLMLPACVLQG